ncbi:MAG TPA: hypothetical protein PLZ15_07650 [Melioribacteraceae bacterium]|nr:hypothetical protein [Melioribacteraceae bacterium]
MRKNSAFIGILFGLFMILIHFLPWTTTESKTGNAFTKGMDLVLTIPIYISLSASSIYMIVFLFILFIPGNKNKRTGLIASLFSIIAAASAIVNIFLLPDDFGTVIIGTGYSFGFGELLYAGIGLYLLAFAGIAGAIVGLRKNSNEESVSPQ